MVPALFLTFLVTQSSGSRRSHPIAVILYLGRRAVRTPMFKHVHFGLDPNSSLCLDEPTAHARAMNMHTRVMWRSLGNSLSPGNQAWPLILLVPVKNKPEMTGRGPETLFLSNFHSCLNTLSREMFKIDRFANPGRGPGDPEFVFLTCTVVVGYSYGCADWECCSQCRGHFFYFV